MFKKILVANRAEIAVRIIRACKELGIKTAAVYSEADKESRHLKLADESHFIGPPQPVQSYLNIEKIVQTAKESASDAIHPGYGFLAQIPRFVQVCEENNITFIGPSSTILEKMANKVVARKIMARAGLQIIPGTMEPVEDLGEAEEVSEKLGYPIIIKAVYGGGGRGMRIVKHKRGLAEAFELTQLEAEASFGSSQVYIEKQLPNPRHIEFQILADKNGNVIHLGERECSIQRKHQKLVEETPSPMMTEALRKIMGEAAVKAANAVNYTNAGTVEFLVDGGDKFYFLEMNTRLQVEHLITEIVTRVDIVKEQILIAAGNPLQFKQEDITIMGHAIDCRINAEDPRRDFAPCPDTVKRYRAPSGPWIRVDSALYEGYTIPVFYDSLIAKLAVWGRNREEAIKRMKNALAEYEIEGVETTIALHKKIMEDEHFVEGRIHTGFIRQRIGNVLLERELIGEDIAALIAALSLSLHKGKTGFVVIPKRKNRIKSRWKTFGRSFELEAFKWGT
ncbi:MAG: acetyl-CoA carboxylase biotin carboxylase subunit [Candidatus Bathyarchaeia archaeon]